MVNDTLPGEYYNDSSDPDPDIKPSELVKILKSTKNLGLMELTYKGLSLKFFDYSPKDQPAYREVSLDQALINDTRQMEFNELDAKEDSIENMMIADPSAYEELIAQDELVDKDE